MRAMVGILAACLLLACGCAKTTRTLSETRGLCYAYSPGDLETGTGGCMRQQEICDEFMLALEDCGATPDCEECLARCRETYNRLARQHYSDGCASTVSRARDICEQYCRSHAHK
ncbi:hypothetical protein GGQ74_000951 [Desulfobaculum xiamenense]|uniref:Lipoprotein n=1 Tax=Desulfobaculum xiamenense TaxID=995050 RepID=A0A846QGF0_9BACT|nr:hypothetical protein [Desulfobaculum xiamenense]NJB67311.1 hypothetical protein [Desulfobaculum xiamenense]